MKILTANRLTDGAVVYLDGAGDWTEAFEGAARFTPEAAEAVLAEANARPRHLVGVYLVEIDEAGVTRRERLREAIRAAGPTVGHSLDAR